MSLNAAAINAIFEAVLQRPASAAEQTFWVSQDASIGDAAVISDIVTSGEASSEVWPIIRVLYVISGGVYPTAAEIANNVAKQASDGQGGTDSFHKIVEDLLGTTAFSTFYGFSGNHKLDDKRSADVNFVKHVYEVAADYVPTNAQVAHDIHEFKTVADLILAVTENSGPAILANLDPTIIANLTAAADAAAQIGPTQKPVVLTTGTNVITQASGDSNVAISGYVGPGVPPATPPTTLHVFDVINPGGTNNSITITDGNGALNATNILVRNNVQTILVTNVTGATNILKLTGVAPAATTLGVVDTAFGTIFGLFNGTQTNTFTVTNFIATGALTPFVFLANAGLTAAGKATGTAALVLDNVPAFKGVGNAGVGIADSALSATDGFASVTVKSIGSVNNDLFTFVDPALGTLTATGSAFLKVDANIAFSAPGRISRRARIPAASISTSPSMAER